MNAKQIKLIALLQAELTAAEATKNQANEDLNEDAFEGACYRIQEISRQIELVSAARRFGFRCENSAAMVAANID